MNAISNFRIAARIYDDIGDYHLADQLDQFVREAGSKAYSPKDFMKALPIMFGLGALGNALTPSPTKPPLEMQQMMEEQSVYDQYGEDSKFDIENYKAQAKPNKPIAKPQPAEEPKEQPQAPNPAPIRSKQNDNRQSPVVKQGPKGNFDETMKIMFHVEGGQTDEDSDRGGRTNLGITQRTYNEWLKKHKLKSSDVFNISKSTALKIYKEEYWNIIKGDQLPHNVAKSMMSMALTDGPQDSVRFVQKLLGIESTGFMGPKTLAAIWAKCKKDDKMFTKQIINAQLIRYNSDEQDKYKQGWGNRLDYVAENID